MLLKVLETLILKIVKYIKKYFKELKIKEKDFQTNLKDIF